MKYPGDDIIKIPSPNSVNTSGYVVKDLDSAFRTFSLYGQLNEVHIGSIFPDSGGAYTRIDNHFQGICRHSSGEYFYVSGSNKQDKESHIFIMKMASYQPSTPNASQKQRTILSNTLYSTGAPSTDQFVKALRIDKDLWHAGGMSMCGDMIVLALEGGNDSAIALIDTTDPILPRYLGTPITRINAKAGCASMVRLVNDHYLCAVWTESGGTHFDLYLSKTKDIKGAYHGPLRVNWSEFTGRNSNEKPRFQSIQFLTDDSGTVGIIGTDNSAQDSQGRNRVFLLTLLLDSETAQDNPVLKKPFITISNPRVIPDKKEYYNFNSVGGTYVSPDNQLMVYGGGTWRKGNKGQFFHLAEFSMSMPDDQTCSSIEDGLIELFGDVNYLGQCLKLDASKHGALADYKKIDGVGGHFNDRFESVRWCLPDTKKVVFFEDKNNNGGNSSKNELTLVGDGTVQELGNLKNTPINSLKYKDKKFGNKISSHATIG